MDKKLFLFIFLTSCFAATHAQSNDVTISNISVNDADVAEFTVSWDMGAVPALWSDSAGLIADCSITDTRFMNPSGDGVTSFTDTADAPGKVLYPSSETFDPKPDAPVGSIWTIIDSRDNKKYRVRKLFDGRIWMVDDLRYGGKNDACSNKTDFDGAVSSVYTHRFGEGTYGDCTNVRNDDTPDNRGYLYDWTAVMQHPDAYYGKDYAGVDGTDPGTAWIRGICPEGFHVPTHAEYVDADDTFSHIDVDSIDKDMWNDDDYSIWLEVYGGYCNAIGMLYEQNSLSGYWTCTQANTSNAYFMEIYIGMENPENHWCKFYGFMLRCVRDY